MTQPPEAAQAQALVAAAPIVPVVSNDEDYRLAADLVRDVKDTFKKVEALRRSVTKPLDDAKAAAQRIFKPYLDDLARREQDIKQTMLMYDRAKRAAIEAQIQAQAAAAAAAELRARDDADLAALAGETVDESEVAVAGLVAGAEVVVDQRPEAAGIHTATTYEAEVYDMDAFAAHCVKTGMFYYLAVNQTLLNQNARALRAEGNWFPGVRINRKESIAVR